MSDDPRWRNEPPPPHDPRPRPDREGDDDQGPPGDRELHARFAALRAEDAARMPGFDQVLRRAGRRKSRRPGRLLPAAGLAAALVAVISVTLLRKSPEPLAHVADVPAASPAGAMSPASPALADWRAPTDFLLDTPGRALLETVPRIGPASSSGARQRRSEDPTPHRPTGEEHPS
jgi:hypothetical protein